MAGRVNRLLVAAAGCGLALAAVAAVAYGVGPVGRADATALAGLRSVSLSHPWIATLANGLAHTVDLPFLLLILAAICGFGLAMGRGRQVGAAVVLVAVANVLCQVLKVLAAHPRYHAVLGPNQLNAEAFPSGHATAVTSLVLAAVLVSPGRWRPQVAVAGAAYAVALSVSLLVAGWHFPSDLVGAYLVVGGVSSLVLVGLTVIEAPEGAQTERRSSVRLRTAGSLVLAAASIGLAIIASAIVISHPGALASYAVSHTTAVIAVLGVAAASVGLVSGVTAELDSTA